MSETLPKPLFAPPPILIRPGEHLRLVKVYVYRCPLCGNEFRYDDPYEPLCSGPRWTDDHAPEVMRLFRIDNRQVVV